MLLDKLKQANIRRIARILIYGITLTIVSQDAGEAITCCLEKDTGDQISYIVLPGKKNSEVNVIDYGGIYEGANKSVLSNNKLSRSKFNLSFKVWTLRLIWVISLVVILDAFVEMLLRDQGKV